MEQVITRWEQDEQGDWIAYLACGHRQHVRHQPPFLQRPWVREASSRERWVGRPLECRLCDEEAAGATEEGGEGPCLAHSVCAECGAIVGEDGTGHTPGCHAAG